MAIMQRPDEMITAMPADWVPGPPQGTWTYDAYAALPDDGKRYEIVQGVLVMTPAPETGHQDISSEMHVCFYAQITARDRGKVYYAPIDVDLGAKNLFQPDLLIILNEHLYRVQKKRIVGPPDLVVEIISPSTIFQDRVAKLNAYEQAGIPEYWLVDPVEKTIEVFVLENSCYISLGEFADEQHVPSRIMPEMSEPVARFIK